MTFKFEIELNHEEYARLVHHIGGGPAAYGDAMEAVVWAVLKQFGALGWGASNDEARQRVVADWIDIALSDWCPQACPRCALTWDEDASSTVVWDPVSGAPGVPAAPFTVFLPDYAGDWAAACKRCSWNPSRCQQCGVTPTDGRDAVVYQGGAMSCRFCGEEPPEPTGSWFDWTASGIESLDLSDPDESETLNPGERSPF